MTVLKVVLAMAVLATGRAEGMFQQAQEGRHTYILITQCLQNDFFLMEGVDPETNFLHIGAEETVRLLGETASTGPLTKVLTLLDPGRIEDLFIVHIRDWHTSDPADANYENYLWEIQQFGRHCESGKDGANFVDGLRGIIEPQLSNKKVFDVLSNSLNDFTGTNLEETLNEILEGRPVDGVVVGIVGVWTDAKVLLNYYDLRTRMSIKDLIVCPSLVASRHPSKHVRALTELESLFGVRIVESVDNFIRELGYTRQFPPGQFSSTKAREDHQCEMITAYRGIYNASAGLFEARVMDSQNPRVVRAAEKNVEEAMDRYARELMGIGYGPRDPTNDLVFGVLVILIGILQLRFISRQLREKQYKPFAMVLGVFVLVITNATLLVMLDALSGTEYLELIQSVVGRMGNPGTT